MLGFKEFLLEGREGYLYHATSSYSIKDILRSNKLAQVTRQRKDKLLLTKPQVKADKVDGVSLTRDNKFAEDWNDIILVLDHRKLAQTHKIIPIDFMSGPQKHYTKARIGNEAEEFVIGSITNLSKYLISLNIMKNAEKKILGVPHMVDFLKKYKHIINIEIPRRTHSKTKYHSNAEFMKVMGWENDQKISD